MFDFFIFFVIKKFISPLADEVYDCGDELLVKRGGREDRIRFSDVMNVNYSVATKPSVIILDLRKESSLGKQIRFCAPASTKMFERNPLIGELITKVDDAKRKAA